MKKIKILQTILLLLVFFSITARAGAVSSFSKSDSVFEVFDAHLTQKYELDGKFYGYVVAETYNQSGVIRLNRELYDSLEEGSALIVQHTKSTSAYSLLKKHQTDTYLVDVKKDNNAYFAVVNDGGEKKTAKVYCDFIEDFVIGQDVELKQVGSELRIYSDSYQNRKDIVKWFLILAVLTALFIKALWFWLRKSFHAKSDQVS